MDGSGIVPACATTHPYPRSSASVTASRRSRSISDRPRPTAGDTSAPRQPTWGLGDPERGPDAACDHGRLVEVLEPGVQTAGGRVPSAPSRNAPDPNTVAPVPKTITWSPADDSSSALHRSMSS